MYTHAHVFTFDYWEACRDVKAGNPGWQTFLAKHRANLIVVEINSHKELVDQLRADGDWQVVQGGQDAESVSVLIAIRKKPL